MYFTRILDCVLEVRREGDQVPGDLVSLGMMHRTKWGCVERRVVMSLFSCSYGETEVEVMPFMPRAWVEVREQVTRHEMSLGSPW